MVVRTWDHRTPKEGTVYLTNGPVSDPFVVFDDYDWRSVIENGIFKEAKHPWHLTSFPQRIAAAVIMHCHFTLLVMTLTTAYHLWQAQQVRAAAASTPLSSALLGGEGAERWRRRLKEENRDTAIVFVGDHYGIFHLAELSVLTGIRLKTLPAHLGRWQDVLAREGITGAPDALARARPAHAPAPGVRACRLIATPLLMLLISERQHRKRAHLKKVADGSE